MKLSILIPTHNRPKLFNRCINSVLSQISSDIEIIVNNDSNDIAEICHPNISYHYNKFDNISLIYKFLLEQSRGEYVYFLEDDDFLVPDFTEINLDSDIIAGNYYPTYNPPYILECMSLFKNEICSPSVFVNKLNLYHLQLSQFIFSRDSIENFEFPMDNNVHNDINLVLHSATNSKSVRTLNKVFFYQTIDGGDNISFHQTYTSINITKSTEFLSKYEIYAPTSHTARS